MGVEARLASLGVELPHAPAPAANYVPFVIERGLLHISGQIPFDETGALIRGRLGETMTQKEGEAAALRCALGLLAQARAATGSLDRIARVVKLGVFVSSTPDFVDQPRVANGASDLMVQVFGESGRHARSAVGVAVLPLGVPVEVDAIFSLTDA